MTLFGKTLDAEQIAGLVSLLALLLFWIMALRREQGALTVFRKWEADRKARRDAELAAEQGVGETETPPPSSGPKRGPWG
ncbi:MAG: hypothetical protein EBR82_38030 [Caulobacteraceae bacterium]|nr:hypothetical protein [Caulobacteraceae bacterium]